MAVLDCNRGTDTSARPGREGNEEGRRKKAEGRRVDNNVSVLRRRLGVKAITALMPHQIINTKLLSVPQAKLIKHCSEPIKPNLPRMSRIDQRAMCEQCQQ